MTNRAPREVDDRPKIRDLPAPERPRERLRDRGAAYLSNAELLAILLRTGTAAESVLDLSARLLAQFQGLDGVARASHHELCGLHGFGEAKAAQLQAAIELGRRISMAQGPDRLAIRSPQDMVGLVREEMSLLEQEHFRVVVLNTKNQVVAVADVHKGSVNATSIRTAEVFREAVRRNCPSVILVHNHPSGDPEPSEEDVAVTQEIVAAGKSLDIDVLDHLVIGRAGFVSLKERGLGF